MFLFKTVILLAKETDKEGTVKMKKGSLEADLSRNAVNIRSIMRNSSDLNIKYAKAGGVSICILFCEGQTDTNQMANLIFRPINSIGNEKTLAPERVMEIMQCELLLAGEQHQVDDYEQLSQLIMGGFCVVLADGVTHGIAVGVQGFETRSVSEPSTHVNLRGSREGFVEAVRTNMSMLRRRIKSPRLVFKLSTVGKLSNTDICLCYIEGKVCPQLLSDIERRLEELPLSVILEGGYIQPFFEERGALIFDEAGITERPDTLAAKLYEGRVGIMIDGTPFALVIPRLFTESFQTLDDYTEKPVYVAIVRTLRYFAFVTSVLLPGFYVALASFHPELIPNSLLLNLAASIQITPYSLLTECLLIHVFYEIMREAGLRMPSNLGHAVSIVGGIVIGDIVVSAGLVGAPLVLIVAVSSIASFIVPDLYNSIVVMRFAFILAGGLWGLFGITVVGLLFLLKICSMNPYGLPYTSPVSPFTLRGMRDTVIRAGWRTLAKSDVKIQNLNGAEMERAGKKNG